MSHDSIQPFSFHARKRPVRVTGLLPAVLTFREGIFEQWCIMTPAKKIFPRVPSKFKKLFWRSISLRSHYIQVVQTVTPEGVSMAESLIKKDLKWHTLKYMISWRFHRKVSLLHDSLGVRKRCTRWVPNNLNEEQKRGRVDWCNHMLRKFDGGRSPRVWDIVTGDETWVYQYDPDTK